MAGNPVFRSMHDVGLAGWFGGSLANAVALNAAAAEAGTANRSGAVANVGWDRWTPVNAAAIGAHLIGSVGELVGNRGRVASQKGVGSMSLVKTGLTAGALGITAWSRALGAKVSQHKDVPVTDGTTPSLATPPEVAGAQRQLKMLQWVIPALTGALIVVSAIAGEQQRPTNVLKGLVERVTG